MPGDADTGRVQQPAPGGVGGEEPVQDEPEVGDAGGDVAGFEVGGDTVPLALLILPAFLLPVLRFMVEHHASVRELDRRRVAGVVHARHDEPA